MTFKEKIFEFFKGMATEATRPKYSTEAEHFIALSNQYGDLLNIPTRELLRLKTSGGDLVAKQILLRSFNFLEDLLTELNLPLLPKTKEFMGIYTDIDISQLDYAQLMGLVEGAFIMSQDASMFKGIFNVAVCLKEIDPVEFDSKIREAKLEKRLQNAGVNTFFASI